MKKTVLLMLLLSVVVLSSCAGMDPQHQQNMITNSAVWGGIGAATGCVVAEIFGGDCGRGAAIGGVGGAYLGAGNTPFPGVGRRQQYSPAYYPESELTRCYGYILRDMYSYDKYGTPYVRSTRRVRVEIPCP